jgi:hypothetical protein
MHEVHDIKYWGFFRVVTIDTTNKGSRPEIHVKAGRSWLNYRIFLRYAELRDNTDKRFSSRHHQQEVLAHIDDDEVSSRSFRSSYLIG